MHSLRRSPARSTTPLAGGCDSVRLWTWAMPLPRWEKGAVPETTVSSPRHLWHVAETTPALFHHRSPSAPNSCAGSLCLRYSPSGSCSGKERERDCVYSGGHKRAKKKGGKERSWTILVTLQGVIGEAVHWETVTWNATHLLATMFGLGCPVSGDPARGTRWRSEGWVPRELRRRVPVGRSPLPTPLVGASGLRRPPREWGPAGSPRPPGLGTREASPDPPGLGARGWVGKSAPPPRSWW